MKTTGLRVRFFSVIQHGFLPALFVMLFCGTPTLASAQTVDWIRHFGSSVKDFCSSVSADRLGGVYVSGYTEGNLGGINAGGADAFVSKYDASGAFEWTAQLGSSGTEQSAGVSTDGLGNVYISGTTTGILGASSFGSYDAFLSKYNSSGTLLWTRQLGTSTSDVSNGVSADGLGNVYISGQTYGKLGDAHAGGNDAFLSKYNDSGTLLWTRQLGSSNYWEGSNAVSVDGLGNVYISGHTEGSLGGTANAGGMDVFLSKYSDSGMLQWTRQMGSSADDVSYGVSADRLGNVYVTGQTFGDLGGANAGSSDVFLAKCDDSGTLQWTRHLGTNSYDVSLGVSVDNLGNAFISGWTGGVLGESSAGYQDAFVSKYDASGTLQWTEQLGCSSTDRSHGVSVDGLGHVYFAGFTHGDFGGRPVGNSDVFVGRITDVPEPGVLAMVACLVLLAGRWGRVR